MTAASQGDPPTDRPTDRPTDATCCLNHFVSGIQKYDVAMAAAAVATKIESWAAVDVAESTYAYVYGQKERRDS